MEGREGKGGAERGHFGSGSAREKERGREGESSRTYIREIRGIKNDGGKRKGLQLIYVTRHRREGKRGGNKSLHQLERRGEKGKNRRCRSRLSVSIRIEKRGRRKGGTILQYHVTFAGARGEKNAGAIEEAEVLGEKKAGSSVAEQIACKEKTGRRSRRFFGSDRCEKRREGDETLLLRRQTPKGERRGDVLCGYAISLTPPARGERRRGLHELTRRQGKGKKEGDRRRRRIITTRKHDG